MTPETQVSAAARDGFATYDELRGPDLDAARWSPARLPLPTGGDHIPLDPNAELSVGEGEVRVTIPRFSLSHDTFPARRQRQVPHLLDAPVRTAAGSARDVRRRARGQEHRWRPGRLPSGNRRLPRFRLRREQARVRRLRHLHPRARAARATGCVGSRRPVLLRSRVAVRGLRRRLHPASRVRDHARPEQIDRGLACRRPHGVRDPRHSHPRTRSHRIRNLDDAADPGRSQSLARRAGHERAVAPVPCTRSRRVSRHSGRIDLITAPWIGGARQLYAGGSTAGCKRPTVSARQRWEPGHLTERASRTSACRVPSTLPRPARRIERARAAVETRAAPPRCAAREYRRWVRR